MDKKLYETTKICVEIMEVNEKERGNLVTYVKKIHVCC